LVAREKRQSIGGGYAASGPFCNFSVSEIVILATNVFEKKENPKFL
jgi:hypothetical protein